MNTDVFARCGEEVRAHDPDRYFSALFAPEARRRGLLALYAFNLEIARVRERTREPVMGEFRLQWWRDALEEIFSGRPPRHDLSEALAQTIEATGLPRAPFDALIEARRFDLYAEPMPTEEALAAYARATASSLVRLAAQALLGTSLNQALLNASEAAGRAWAYTGILRALPIHAARRQLFLPEEHLIAAGGDVESVFAGNPTPALAQAVRVIATSARVALDEARAAFVLGETPGALPAFLMLALVPPVLERVERRGFDPFHGGAEPSSLFRLFRLAGGGLLGRF